MNNTIILEDNIKLQHQKNWYLFLSFEKHLVELSFDWLKLVIDEKSRSIYGKGTLVIADRDYKISISYSPFFKYRYDRIRIDNHSIVFNNKIHVYNDLSLCLYHPIIDKPFLKTIPLVKMIPWITEWIIFYNQWKKYGVWLGKEIKH